MSVDRQQLRHLAALARLAPGAGGEERPAADLERIVDYVRRIGDGGEEPQGPPEPGWEDEDAVRQCLARDDVLAAAPEAERGYVRVPPLRPPRQGEASGEGGDGDGDD